MFIASPGDLDSMMDAYNKSGKKVNCWLVHPTGWVFHNEHLNRFQYVVGQDIPHLEVGRPITLGFPVIVSEKIPEMSMYGVSSDGCFENLIEELGL